MPLTVQATTMNGMIVEQARWRIEDPGLRPGDLLQISLPVKDRKLMEYVRNQSKFECMLERGKDGSSHSAILAFRIKQIRHMLDSQTSEIDSMCVVAPMDRFVESVMTFLLDRKRCDPKFVAQLSSPQNRQK